MLTKHNWEIYPQKYRTKGFFDFDYICSNCSALGSKLFGASFLFKKLCIQSDTDYCEEYILKSVL